MVNGDLINIKSVLIVSTKIFNHQLPLALATHLKLPPAASLTCIIPVPVPLLGNNNN